MISGVQFFAPKVRAQHQLVAVRRVLKSWPSMVTTQRALRGAFDVVERARTEGRPQEAIPAAAVSHELGARNLRERGSDPRTLPYPDPNSP